nr:cellulase family glycosylhydrolase [uncultured Carboxylicivirga sp.]
MKRINNNVFLLILLVVSLNACSDNEEKVDPELVVSISELSFDKQQESDIFHVKSNVNWTAESSADWCSISPSEGGVGTSSIDVIVDANDLYDERNAQITIKAGDIIKNVSVIQAKNYSLVLDQTLYSLTQEEQDLTITFTRSEDVQIMINDPWISQKELKSVINDSKEFVVQANSGMVSRKGTITFTLNDITEIVTITQEGVGGGSVPADMTGVESNAIELAQKIIAGWNVGNSLEVPGGETGWGNPKVNKDLIDAVKAAGFNAVRIPCAWDGYIVDRETYEISSTWLARVKEVVDYCIDNDMYAVINTHWDGGWLENNPTYDKQNEVNEQLYAIWQQVGIYFRDYDEHLLFAGTNEVHVENVYTKPTNENIEVQQSFNQTFVDAVRSTGGKNAYRNLIVQTYNTNIGWGVELHNMPTDEADGRLFVEVHYYDPYEFTLSTGNGHKILWGEGYDNSYWGQEDYVESTFASMKTTFYDKGIPIILGEYGAMYRSTLSGEDLALHNESRNYFLKTVTEEAKANGFVPFIWDNGGDDFGLFNRHTAEQIHPDAIQAIIDGASN